MADEDVCGSVNRVVMPGDIIGNVADLETSSGKRATLKFGPGLREENGVILAFKAGVLRHRKPATYLIDSNQRRYVPVKEERVIGVVTNRGYDSYKVDIGGSLAASLPNLSFEGATKKNKPNIQIGDIIYARLCVANKDMEPELDCRDVSGKSSGMGQLTGGFMITCSLGLCRKLLSKEFVLLKSLGNYFPFECTVGMNGKVWINASSTSHTIIIANAITNSEYMTNNQVESMVKQIVNGL
ncbi:PREDICTED: putative exosome complex component rrp40 [Acropora digitifera]|uniref:putative exosome complex component rrp40 n=1 Tax=Acropora digitifera TaxID=70779 RepID=UPI00077A5658|nr:PREDICTED: putative exosome complex component rrp40 [Acropora digitifera]